MATSVWKISTITNRPRMNINGECPLRWAARAATGRLASPLAQKPQLVPRLQLPVLSLPPLIQSRWAQVFSQEQRLEVLTTVPSTSSLRRGSLAPQSRATVLRSTQGSAKATARWNEQLCSNGYNHSLELKCSKFKPSWGIFEVQKTFSNLPRALSYICHSIQTYALDIYLSKM